MTSCGPALLSLSGGPRRLAGLSTAQTMLQRIRHSMTEPVRVMCVAQAGPGGWRAAWSPLERSVLGAVALFTLQVGLCM
jgi:hypothetical protein